MNKRLAPKDFLRADGIRSLILSIAITVSFCSQAFSQGPVVQLPTYQTFSLQSSSLVPDQGAAFMGGIQQNRIGSMQRGNQQAIGGSTNRTGAVTKVTVVDLDELDRMIRSQANSTPVDPNWSKHINKSSRDSIGALPSDRKPSYAYMLPLTQSINDPLAVETRESIDDARYYLTLAANARQREHWSSVELFYRMAWNSLPANRRNSAWIDYLEAREKISEEEDALRKSPTASKF